MIGAAFQLTVTVLTYETGGAVWERWGHNALWIHDAAAGTDRHYDYGRFDFNAPNFFLRFAQGRMWYSMGVADDPARYIAFYTGEGREIWSQELALTQAQAEALRDFLEWNARPENAGYAYDYYLDNCSTRIRDAIDRVTGGALRQYGRAPSGMTWREETRRLNQHNPLLYTGLLAALGHPVDREMSRWEQMFLPGRVRQHLDSVRVAGPDGVLHPLVRSEVRLAAGGRWPVPDRPSDWTWRYLGVGLLLGGTLAWLGPRRRRAFGVLAGTWTVGAGVVGGALTWLWGWSHHVAAYRNENLFLFNLLLLVLAVLLPRGGRRAEQMALVVLAVAGLGLVAKLLPGFGQRNLELMALALPAHAGVWLGLRGRAPT